MNQEIQTIKVDNNDCIILTTANVENEEYLYLAKIEENDITGEFFVYQRDRLTGNLTKITDSEKLKRILLVVSANLVN